MLYERNNVDKTRAVLVSFAVYFVYLSLLILIIVDHNFSITGYKFTYQTRESFGLALYFLLILNGIIFLIWYQSVNKNYSKISKTDESWYLVGLFIPFLTIIYTYYFFNTLKNKYASKVKKMDTKGYVNALRVWGVSFFLLHLLIIFSDKSSEFKLIIGFCVIQLIGLSSMIKIIMDVDRLEADFFKKNDELDIADHFIGEDEE